MTTPGTPLTEAEAAEVLRRSMLNLGRLLPDGMAMRFVREAGETRTRLQVCLPCGTTTESVFTRCSPIHIVPVVHALADAEGEL